MGQSPERQRYFNAEAAEGAENGKLGEALTLTPLHKNMERGNSRESPLSTGGEGVGGEVQTIPSRFLSLSSLCDLRALCVEICSFSEVGAIEAAERPKFAVARALHTWFPRLHGEITGSRREHVGMDTRLRFLHRRVVGLDLAADRPVANMPEQAAATR